jgi:MFS family permease
VALGCTQILGYGSSYYLPAVLAEPIAADTHWPLEWVIGGLSIGLLAGGLVSAPVGRLVDSWGGRPVLTLGSLLFATGLAAVGLATHLYAYLLAWCVVGLGMGTGLYDATFAALGRAYGLAARGPITVVTLFGGFASTICWPLSAYLVAAFGWRWTCFVYAAIHLLVALPLHALLAPRPALARTSHGIELRATASAQARRSRALLLLVATSLTLAAVVVAIISVHLLTLLQQGGYSAAAAVAVGALIGPSQVAGRLAELVLGHRLHPAWTALLSAVLMAIGILLLTADIRLAAVAIAVYAAGGGVIFVVRGTLPLALFGSEGYGTLMGRLALPSLVGQALAPWLAAMLSAHWGTGALLAVLVLLAFAQVAINAAILPWRHATPGEPDRIE